MAMPDECADALDALYAVIGRTIPDTEHAPTPQDITDEVNGLHAQLMREMQEA